MSLRWLCILTLGIAISKRVNVNYDTGRSWQTETTDQEAAPGEEAAQEVAETAAEKVAEGSPDEAAEKALREERREKREQGRKKREESREKEAGMVAEKATGKAADMAAEKGAEDADKTVADFFAAQAEPATLPREPANPHVQMPLQLLPRAHLADGAEKVVAHETATETAAKDAVDASDSAAEEAEKTATDTAAADEATAEEAINVSSGEVVDPKPSYKEQPHRRRCLMVKERNPDPSDAFEVSSPDRHPSRSRVKKTPWSPVGQVEGAYQPGRHWIGQLGVPRRVRKPNHKSSTGQTLKQQWAPINITQDEVELFSAHIVEALDVDTDGSKLKAWADAADKAANMFRYLPVMAIPVAARKDEFSSGESPGEEEGSVAPGEATATEEESWAASEEDTSASLNDDSPRSGFEDEPRKDEFSSEESPSEEEGSPFTNDDSPRSGFEDESRKDEFSSEESHSEEDGSVASGETMAAAAVAGDNSASTNDGAPRSGFEDEPPLKKLKSKPTPSAEYCACETEDINCCKTPCCGTVRPIWGQVSCCQRAPKPDVVRLDRPRRWGADPSSATFPA